jgi:hypothetical protein
MVNPNVRTEVVQDGGRRVALHTLDNSEALPCGECRACCTALGVQELSRGNYERCEHICEAGCAIYAERPDSCRIFSCWWKLGEMGDERRRPDRLGVILESVPGFFRAWEVWPEASRLPEVRYVFEKLRRKYGVPIFVVTEEIGKEAWGYGPDNPPPPELAAKIERMRFSP